jgi:hypothetical protein
VLLIVSAFVLQVFFFAPIHVISQNFGEFPVPFVNILALHLALSLALILIVFLVVRILELHILTAALTFFSLVAFLESWLFYLLAGHHPLSEEMVDWEALQGLSSIELAVALVAAVVLVVFRKRIQLLARLSLSILVLLILVFAYDTVSKVDELFSKQQTTAENSPYLDHFYRLSSERNVIHIVPDQAQGAMLNDILSTDYEQYARAFDGFTLFRQAVGGFESSYPAVVFNMSGESPDPAFDMVQDQPFTSDYIEEVLRERSILTVLSQNSFKLFGFQFNPEVFCKGPYTACSGSQEQVFTGVPLNDPKWRLAVAAVTSWDLALFRMSPLKLRALVYDDGRWFARKLAAFGGSRSGVIDVFKKRIQVEDSPGTYNYFHHAGARPPLLFDRNCKLVGSRAINSYTQGEQLRCMLKQLGEMIEALKQAGVYDQTMIVINGGLGTQGLAESVLPRTGNGVSPALMGTASTLLLIKPPGANGPLVFSDKPATIGDVPVTIMDGLGFKSGFPGEALFGRDLSAGRERVYFTFEAGEKVKDLQTLQNLSRFRIQGDVFDERAWVLPVTAGEGRYLSLLRVDHPEFASYSEGFGALEQHRIPVRWVDGDQARVFLSPPLSGPVDLEFDSYAPSELAGQSMEIRVNGVKIVTLDQIALSDSHHRVPLPVNLPREQLLEIEFTMAKTVYTGDDLRQLSVLFSYIGLVSSD